jgi:rhodanese-related sulfurtransferase
MVHSPGFLKAVDEARPRVKEISLEETRRRLDLNPQAILMDVREDKEWEKGHAQRAVHLGRGVLERDIEELIPNKQTEILMYCGGGYRSVLACDVAQRMGYGNVHSVQGGYRTMVASGWPMA